MAYAAHRLQPAHRPTPGAGLAGGWASYISGIVPYPGRLMMGGLIRVKPREATGYYRRGAPASSAPATERVPVLATVTVLVKQFVGSVRTTERP
jgi:hypothetical protein